MSFSILNYHHLRLLLMKKEQTVTFALFLPFFHCGTFRSFECCKEYSWAAGMKEARSPALSEPVQPLSHHLSFMPSSQKHKSNSSLSDTQKILVHQLSTFKAQKHKERMKKGQKQGSGSFCNEPYLERFFITASWSEIMTVPV